MRFLGVDPIMMFPPGINFMIEAIAVHIKKDPNAIAGMVMAGVILIDFNHDPREGGINRCIRYMPYVRSDHAISHFGNFVVRMHVSIPGPRVCLCR